MFQMLEVFKCKWNWKQRTASSYMLSFQLQEWRKSGKTERGKYYAQFVYFHITRVKKISIVNFFLICCFSSFKSSKKKLIPKRWSKSNCRQDVRLISYIVFSSQVLSCWHVRIWYPTIKKNSAFNSLKIKKFSARIRSDRTSSYFKWQFI